MAMPEVLTSAINTIMADAPAGDAAPGGDAGAPGTAGEQATTEAAAGDQEPATEGDKAKDEKKPAKPKPTPEELTHYRKLQRREAQIERKSKELTDREQRFEAGLKALEVRQQEFESMIRDFIDGDADKKLAVLARTHGGDLPTLMRKLSETVAGVEKPKTEADLVKLLDALLEKKLEPIKQDKAKREAEEKAKAEREQRSQLDQQVRIDLQAELGDAGSWPLTAELAQLLGAETVLTQLWKTGVAMVKLGKDDPKTYRRYSRMTPETAPTMIARQYELYLRTNEKAQAFLKEQRANKQNSPGAGTGSSTPAASLSTGQASTPSTARRLLTVEERENHHQQFDPKQILRELGVELPNT